MQSLRRIIGRELPLDQYHLIVRRAAAHTRAVTTYGSCLVTCSDERQGQLRGSFERDVATPLISDVSNARDRVFSVSNLCGRLEPGAFALVDNHFTRLAGRGPKLLVFEIASHVGRIREDASFRYGEVDRFGQRSPCCGALTTLLDPTAAMGAVRHPWFEQLNAFFGPVRLETLRANRSPTRMVAAAIIHATLQAESAVAEVINEPPETTTEVLLLAGVAVNQQWSDGFLPVAFHHLRVEDGETRILDGFSLRTSPEALDIDVSGPRILVAVDESMERAEGRERTRSAPVAAREPAAGHTHGRTAGAAHAAERAADEKAIAAAQAAIEALPAADKAALEDKLDEVREQVASVRHNPTLWRTYSRPLLRGLFRALCVVQPEVGIAAMLYEGGENLFAAHQLRQVLQQGPRSVAGRRALHDIEAELQQLNHQDAQQVLDLLLAAKKL